MSSIRSATNGFIIDHLLSNYIKEVSKFPMLTCDEEIELMDSWCSNGDINAAHKLVTSHLRLVVKIVFKFRNYGLPLLELISEGNIGLMKAVKKFKPEIGCRLATYSIWWIKASIQEYILKSWSLVKISTSVVKKKLFSNLHKTKQKLMSTSYPNSNNLTKIHKYHDNDVMNDVNVDTDGVNNIDSIDSIDNVDSVNFNFAAFEDDIIDGGQNNHHTSYSKLMNNKIYTTKITTNTTRADNLDPFNTVISANIKKVDEGIDIDNGVEVALNANDQSAIGNIAKAAHITNVMISLNKIQDAESETELIDIIKDDSLALHDDGMIERETNSRRIVMLKNALTKLTKREKHILYARRLQDKPAILDVLAKTYNISRERIRQIEEKTIDKLSKLVKAQENVSNKELYQTSILQ